MLLASTYFSTLRFSGEPLAWLIAFGAGGLMLIVGGIKAALFIDITKKSQHVLGMIYIAAGVMAIGGGVYLSLTSAEASYKHNALHQKVARQLDKRYGKLIAVRNFDLSGDISFTVGRARTCTHHEFALIKTGGQNGVTEWVIVGYTDAKTPYPISGAGFRQMTIDCDELMPQD